MIAQRYPEHFIAPMREELTTLGFEELRTPESVDAAVARPGTTLLVVNSVCGCAAGKARPGIAMALRHSTKPSQLTTVFAGADLEATTQARAHMAPYPPSSPVDCAAQGRQGRLHPRAPRHRRPSGRTHRAGAHRRLRHALLIPTRASTPVRRSSRRCPTA